MSSDYNPNRNLVHVDDNIIKSFKTCHIEKMHVNS